MHWLKVSVNPNGLVVLATLTEVLEETPSHVSHPRNLLQEFQPAPQTIDEK